MKNIPDNKFDTNMIYLTGLNMGGYATFDLLGIFGKGAHIAAAVPICGIYTWMNQYRKK